MMARVITALVLATLLLCALFLAPPGVGAALIGAFILLGAREWALFAGWRAPLPRYAYVLAVALLAAAVYGWQQRSAANLQLLLGLTLVWWLAATAWVIVAPSHGGRWLAAAAGALVLVPTGVVLLRLILAGGRGPQWALFMLALAFITDTGALFAGRAFGRVKLSPSVSPGKTWEGVIGGVACAALVALAGARWFALSAAQFVPLCLAAAAFSVVGDLTESMLKRQVGMKDSGHLFPGHGGVLDRIDSATAAVPAMALGLLWLGVPW